MDFSAEKKQIGGLLINKKQYCVPRYQREYSWEINEISEFMEDILSQINLVNESDIENKEYFFGSILLVGDLNGSKKELEIVDGQQRFTTITILLSALAKIFSDNDEESLANNVWKYIMTKDDDDNSYAILKNETPNPYFQYYIQMKEDSKIDPKDEEEDRIKNAYEYFIGILNEKNIKKTLKRLNNQSFEFIEYVKILKSVRDQLLNSFVICIWTKDKKYGNLVFEILNAKGKKLASIDLIKNHIFSYLNQEQPTDDAKNRWKNIKGNLSSRESRIDTSTFFRHYWCSKYAKVSEEKLYDSFIKKIKKDVNVYKKVISDIEYNSQNYMKIVCPILSDYQNRKEFNYIVESSKTFTSVFSVTQVRVALLALYDARFTRNLITNKEFKKILLFLDGFHFANNGICSKRSNTLETKYSQFAIKLNKSTEKQECSKIIKELQNELEKIIPSYNEFKEKFIKLEYSKTENKTNMLSKYVVNSFEKYYSKSDV